MGKLFSKCLESKPARGNHNRRITYVPPNQILDTSTSMTQEQIDKFFYIPNEEQVDKAIEYLDECTVVTEKDIYVLNEILFELRTLSKKHKTCLLSNKPADQLYVGSQIVSQEQLHMTRTPRSVERGVTMKRSHTIGTGFKDFLHGGDSAAKDKQEPALLIKVQSARFLHENMLKKHQLQSPYVVMKIYQRPYTKLQYSCPPPQAEVKSFTTEKASESIRPDWDEFFEYGVNIPEEEKEVQFPLYSVGISLFYKRGTGEPDWQVGTEQHFSLSSLVDQRMQKMIIDYRDTDLKGVLARLKVNLQLAHKVDELRERLLQDVDVRIEKLLKIKQKHVLSVGGRATNATSMLNSMGNDQSLMSVYSYSEAKDSEYYLA